MKLNKKVSAHPKKDKPREKSQKHLENKEIKRAIRDKENNKRQVNSNRSVQS